MIALSPLILNDMQMKTLTLLLLLLFPLAGFTQNEIPKNSDKIIVSNDKTAQDNFIIAKQALADADIEILGQDRDVFQIKTGKIIFNESVSYSYLINCRDGKISITGTWTNNVNFNSVMITRQGFTYPIQYKAKQKVLFNKMNDFAKQLGEKLDYQSSVEAPQINP